MAVFFPFERLNSIENKLSRLNAKGLVEPDTFAEASKTIQETRLQLERAAAVRVEEGKAVAATEQQERSATAAKDTFLSKHLKVEHISDEVVVIIELGS
ncbi:hypothetical protein Z042_23680 [Chania multitudinisentens RB-25]|uniref:Uncharacterized protein n=1 Tax=Chania multitudinisentens RB-25 TaxID=1441930 RepID=W0LL06_9GAMM|nr:hypothetical protein [Chania multitudinisentens]AHG23012.1 hypothetical protein Z042_23680 [Chania multitudinisentens RB-25]